MRTDYSENKSFLCQLGMFEKENSHGLNIEERNRRGKYKKRTTTGYIANKNNS